MIDRGGRVGAQGEGVDVYFAAGDGDGGSLPWRGTGVGLDGVGEEDGLAFWNGPRGCHWTTTPTWPRKIRREPM